MRFKYSATDSKTGCRISDIAEAESLPALTRHLREKGLRNIKAAVLPLKGRRRQRARSHRSVSRKEVKIFTRQMASTLNAGFVLSEALETLAEDLENSYFGTVIRHVSEDVHAGVDFSTALSRYPGIFSASYTSIIRAGEATGWLHKTMADLARYLEDSERLREKVKNAVSYPLFVLGFALLIIVGMMVFVVPLFQNIFDQFDRDLPRMTQMLIGLSEFLRGHALELGALLVALAFMMSAALKLKPVRALADVVILKIPIVGTEVIHKSLVSQFCRTLSFLMVGGVPLPQALDITKGIIRHIPMRRTIDDLREHVVAGGMLSDMIRTNEYFPNFVFKMIQLGEKSGKLHEMLGRAADYYEEEIEFSLYKLTSLLEPVLIALVGGIVAAVIVALYLPIFTMSQLVY